MSSLSNSGARKIKFLGLALGAVCVGLLLFAVSPRAHAADFRGGDRVVIDAATVVDDDLYITAREVVIDGTVNGDLYAFGENITLNGKVERDVIAAGASVVINGTIGNSLRVGGQNIQLGAQSKIGHTALLGAFSVETQSGSVIGHDLVLGAYQAAIGGAVRQDVVAGANAVEISGSVGRNARVSVGESDMGMSALMFMPPAAIPVPNVPPGLTIAPTAKIGGALVYESNAPANVTSGAQVTGPITQQTPMPNENRVPPTPEQIQAERQRQTFDYFLNALRRFIILLLIGLGAVWLLPQWIGALAELARTKPLGSLGRGVLMALGYFVVAVILVIVMVTLAVFFGILTLGALVGVVMAVGIVLFGVLTVGYWLFVSYAAPIVVSFLVGKALLERMQATWAQNRFLQFSVGLILLSLALLIPLVNLLLGILVALFALGALWLWLAPRVQGRDALVTPTFAG